MKRKVEEITTENEEESITIIKVPSFDIDIIKSSADFKRIYSTTNLLHLTTSRNINDKKNFVLKNIRKWVDAETWTVENYKDLGVDAEKELISPESFLDWKNTEENSGYYCSFIVQKDKNMLNEVLSCLPVVELPFESSILDENTSDLSAQLHYGPAVWFFYGINNQTQTMAGRPLHTDSISHDGTWHYQVSGKKIWNVKPTEELINMWINGNHSEGKTDTDRSQSTSTEQIMKKLGVNDDNSFAKVPKLQFVVECSEGDIIIINTRMWWHQTNIPPCGTEPSLSYARDIFIDETKREFACQMTNLDGTYATSNIEEGVIIFTEHNMPDIELHRCKNREDANCKLVYLQEERKAFENDHDDKNEDDDKSGVYGAVVSTKSIKAGEFFCLPESSDDDDSEEEDEEEEEEIFDEE